MVAFSICMILNNPFIAFCIKAMQMIPVKTNLLLLNKNIVFSFGTQEPVETCFRDSQQIGRHALRITRHNFKQVIELACLNSG